MVVRIAPDAGSFAEVTTAKVVRATRLVRTGRVYDLAHVLDADVPAFDGRSFEQSLVEEGGPMGRNAVHWVAERFTTTSQIGTHVDGLNHLHVGDEAYGGRRVADIVTPSGTSELGIETLPQLVTRGLLLDVSPLDSGDVVTVEAADAALARIGAHVEPGDAVLFHTGWGRLWDTDPVRYLSGEPGPGVELVEWLASRHVSLTGCDTWSYGPVPPEDADEPFVVPQTLNVRHGIVIAENLRLAELAADGVGEFLFVMSHPKLRGATGAWTAPLAIV